MVHSRIIFSSQVADIHNETNRINISKLYLRKIYQIIINISWKISTSALAHPFEHLMNTLKKTHFTHFVGQSIMNLIYCLKLKMVKKLVKESQKHRQMIKRLKGLMNTKY